MRAYHRAERHWLTMLLAAASSYAGCGPRSSATDVDAPQSALCSARLAVAEPSLPAPALPDLPSSQLTLDFDVATARLGRELETRVPVVLAKEQNRGIGVAGVADYEVRRGGFTFTTEDRAVVVMTPIRTSIEVCKPFGPICIGYGRCKPELLSRARVPVTLGADYELEPARVSVKIERPCHILGTDVTASVREIADREARRVEQRIAAERPSVARSVHAVWQILKLPIAIGSALCIRIEPERVEQSLPKLANGLLSTSASVIAKVRVEEPCTESKARERALPAPQALARVGDGIALNVPIHMAWHEVDADLTRSLANARVRGSAGSMARINRITRLRSRGTTRGERAAIALAASVEGSICGDLWFLAEPFYDRQASRIRLRDVRLAQASALLSPGMAEELELLIAEHARISLPIDPGSTAGALRGLALSLEKQLPPGMTLELELDPAEVHPIYADDRALIPVVGIRGAARLTLR